MPPLISTLLFYSTTLYFIFLFLFVFFRVIVFNFALKDIKRPLSIGYDISLFIFTSVWLLSLHMKDMMYYGYDSPALFIAASAYVFSIFDFIYNFILYKKIKSTSP